MGCIWAQFESLTKTRSTGQNLKTKKPNKSAMADDEEKSDKIRVSAYELMTLLGSVKPCLSQKFKDILDEERAKPEYAEYSEEQAWGLAFRYLATQRQDSFDLRNKDDAVALRLMPYFLGEDGLPVDKKALFKRFEPENARLDLHDKGDHAMMEISSCDGDREYQTTMRMDKNDPDKKPSYTTQFIGGDRTRDLTGNQIDEKLRILKMKVLETEDFRVSFEHYVAEFAEDEEFMELGRSSTKAPRLRAQLRNISKRLFPDGNHKVTQFRLKHLANHRFVHGTALVSGRRTMLFFFQDTGFGMGALEDFVGTHYVRLTIAAKPED